MSTMIPPATDESMRATEYDARLIIYLRTLPDCGSVEDVLELTLDHALALTGGTSGVALASGNPLTLVATDRNDQELAVAARAVWLAAESQVEFMPGGAPQIMPGEAQGFFYFALHTAEALHGLLALRIEAEDWPRPQAVIESLEVMAQAAGSMLLLQLSLSRASQRLSELSLLYEVATAMSSTLDLPSLLTSIVQRTQAALRSEACTLMLLDENTQELVFEIPVGGAEKALRQLRVPLSQGICGWVARNARPAIVNDLSTDPRFDIHVDQNSGFSTRTALCVPLLMRGRVSGVIEVLNKEEGEAYTEHDLALLTALAGQAAVALDNAQLYTSLQVEHERFLAAEEQVRKELARDLHDGPAQQMAAICMEVEVLRKLLTVDASRIPGELDSLDALARKANRQVRTLQFQLRPVMLETRGLRAAIEYYVNQLRETERIQFTMQADGCKERLASNVEQAAFGIIQESLGNIRKHSSAQNVLIAMHPAPGKWVIRITDDGAGFDVATVLRSYETRGSLGLLNMRERAQSVGGNLDLASAPGQGTSVTLEIPTTGFLRTEDSMAAETPSGVGQ